MGGKGRNKTNQSLIRAAKNIQGERRSEKRFTAPVSLRPLASWYLPLLPRTYPDLEEKIDRKTIMFMFQKTNIQVN